MSSLFAPINSVQGFLDAGGPVLWLILALSIILWSLIIERYWYFYRIHPGLLHSSRKVFQDIQLSRWHKNHIRDAMISQISLNLTRSLPQIRTLIMLCPLFGLLGTVTGMIQVFDVVALTGTGNAKAMASGISMATIPTMAGLVTALSGFYFSMRLKHHARRETMRAFDLINDQGETKNAA